MSTTKEPKPSAIPLPQTTPTKTTSFMTPYGYKSPRDSPPSPSPKRASGGASGVATRDELMSLKQKVEAKEQLLNELKSAVLTLKTQIQQSDLTQKELEDQFHGLSKQLQIKENELRRLDEEKVENTRQIERDYELKKRQLKLDNDTSIYNLEKGYKTEIEAILSHKVGEIQQRKNQLKEDIAEFEHQIKDNDSIVQDGLSKIKDKYEEKQKELQKFMQTTRESLEKEIDDLKVEKQTVIDHIKQVLVKKEKLEDQKTADSMHLDTLRTQNSDTQAHIQSLAAKITELEQALTSKKSTIESLKKEMEWKINTKTELDTQLIKEEDTRRKLHNKLQNLKGNIRVFCRIRPKIASEASDEQINISVPDNDEAKQEINILDSTKKFNFQFDKVFQQSTSNPEIFEEISQLVQSALYGYNICIFAYGQTGSGKTYTMSGDDGMIPLSIQQIFDSCEQMKKKQWDFKVTGEFLEIYNESINDLLSSSGNKHEIKHDATTKTTTITNLTTMEFSSPEEMNITFQRALNNRSIASTKANERSSRSHTVCIIRLEGRNATTGETTRSVLNLIDLAGSERISHSQVSGDRLKETQAINKSLSCLGDVIYALGDQNAKHVPFRNSKLTYLLQYSLIEESKTLMFVNISPLAENVNETVNSLRFATKVNKVVT